MIYIKIILTLAVITIAANIVLCRESIHMRAQSQSRSREAFHDGVLYGTLAAAEYLKAGSNNVLVGELELRALAIKEEWRNK